MSRCNHSVITKRMVTFIAVMGSVCVMTLLYGAILSMPNSKFLTLNGVNNVTVKVLINNVLETSDNLDYPTFSIGNDLKKGVNTIKHSESDREKNVGQTLLMKLQKLLSSQPKSAKNSFQFNSIQRHLDTLLAMSVSQTVENKTTDDVSDSKKPSQLHLDQVEANVGRETGNEKRKEKKKEISAAIGETTTSAKLVTTEKPYCETQKYLSKYARFYLTV